WTHTVPQSFVRLRLVTRNARVCSAIAFSRNVSKSLRTVCSQPNAAGANPRRMLFRLFIAAVSLLHPNDTITRGLLADAVVHARAVAYDDDEAPLFAGDEGRFKTALLLISIAHHESRWNPKALNPAGDSGIMQTRSIWWEGHTREEILSDAELGYR